MAKSKMASKSLASVASQPTWTLNIEGLGKVKSAQIKMAPLVMLVGQNNTGKSQVASMLWGVMNASEYIFNNRTKNVPVPDWFLEKLYFGSDNDESKDFVLTDEEIISVEQGVNSLLKEMKDDIVRAITSYDDISVKKLEIRLGDDFPLRCVRSVVRGVEDRGARFGWVDGDAGAEGDGRCRLEVGVARSQSSRSFEQVLFGLFAGGVLAGGGQPFGQRAVYIPAARTGLMLAFRTLVSDLIGSLGWEREGAPSAGRFPAPTVKFLQALNDVRKSKDAKFSKIAQSIEKSVLGGVIKSDEGATKSFSYVVDGADLSLPLHVSSSMVTELAPFMVLLRSGALKGGVVFEEPEAHLHLSAQRVIARAIARLVNAGVPVVVTTHSDTFVQQLNISMQLFNHPRSRSMCRAFGYSKDEVINPSFARAYEFVGTEQGTVVKELSKASGGFVVPSLNDPLERLMREVLEIGH